MRCWVADTSLAKMFRSHHGDRNFTLLPGLGREEAWEDVLFLGPVHIRRLKEGKNTSQTNTTTTGKKTTQQTPHHILEHLWIQTAFFTLLLTLHIPLGNKRTVSKLSRSWFHQVPLQTRAPDCHESTCKKNEVCMTNLASAANCCWVNISDHKVGQKKTNKCPHICFTLRGEKVVRKSGEKMAISHPFGLTLAADTIQEGKWLPWECSLSLSPPSFILSSAPTLPKCFFFTLREITKTLENVWINSRPCRR